MYAVIFKARIAEFDDEYLRLTERLKALAFEKYGCRDFVSVTEGDKEIAISYWDTMQNIHDWKEDPEHRFAQKRGRKKWYKAVDIEICEIVETKIVDCSNE
jgi:heme-degrading monooxygenase HmoA